MNSKLLLLIALALLVHPGLDWLAEYQFAKTRPQPVAPQAGRDR